MNTQEAWLKWFGAAVNERDYFDPLVAFDIYRRACRLDRDTRSVYEDMIQHVTGWSKTAAVVEKVLREPQIVTGVEVE